MKPIIICHIIIGLETGGAERMLARLVTAVASSKEFDVHVISLTTLGVIGRELQRDGVKVSTVGWRGVADTPLMLVRLAGELIKLKPDIVQTWMYHADLFGGVVARLVGIRSVIWGIRASVLPENAPLTTRLARSVCALLSGSVPKTIICNSETGKSFHQRIGYSSQRLLVIPNGFEMKIFSEDQSSRRYLRDNWQVQPTEKLIGMVGRDSPDKNPVGFLEAVAKVFERTGNAKAVMVGRGFTRENERLTAFIERLGVSDRVVLAGERADIAGVMTALDVFVLPSLSEGFPNVVAEAMAMKKICVVTDVGDAGEIVGECGIIVAPGDPEAVSNGIMAALELSTAATVDLGYRARERIQSKFSLHSITEQFCDVYRQLVLRSRQRDS
nr:glycosyltransferase [Oxalobacteraceae bacterium]